MEEQDVFTVNGVGYRAEMLLLGIATDNEK